MARFIFQDFETQSEADLTVVGGLKYNLDPSTRALLWSWGIDIDRAIVGLRTTPHMLLFPSLFLSLAVLAFIMLGDVVRDALDPKNR